ncbi:MAG TPA: ABC transporter transmembrane domain-containing protein [Chitinophagales bacterium]
MAEENKKRVSGKEIKHALSIYKFILPYKWHFAIGMFCLVVSTSVVSVIPMGFGKLVDAATLQNMKSDQLLQTGVLLGVILLIQAVFSFFRIYLFEYVSQNAMANIRKAVYQKIITQPIYFFESTRVGELTSRITNDIAQLQESLSTNLAMLVRQLVLPVACIPFLFAISANLTFFMLGTFPVMIIVAVVFGRYIRAQSKGAQDALAHANVIVEETFQGIDVVKAFTNERYESNRYATLNEKVVEVFIKASKFRAAFVSFIIFAMFGAIVLIVWKGLSLVAAHEITFGELIKFLLYTVFIGASLAGLSESYALVQKTVGASERIQEILQEGEEILIEDDEKTLSVNGDIELKNVSFAYPSRADIQILDSISLSAKAGEKIALVGPSGSGKSTIIKLLAKLYAINQGEILIDGQNVNSLNTTALRKNIGTVPQDTMLFGGTIRENIAYGRTSTGIATNATEEEIISAAKKAYAFDFIQQFPDGFDTLVGERGVKLSGGQRQRIAIARAILRDPKILLLDEATSALDSESERLVKQALDELMKGRTTFIIAHRLSTIREADKIIVMNKGKIVETGSHQELSKIQDGLYNHLLKLQYSES